MSAMAQSVGQARYFFLLADVRVTREAFPAGRRRLTTSALPDERSRSNSRMSARASSSVIVPVVAGLRIRRLITGDLLRSVWTGAANAKKLHPGAARRQPALVRGECSVQLRLATNPPEQIDEHDHKADVHGPPPD